jgi:hypothetical protein
MKKGSISAFYLGLLVNIMFYITIIWVFQILKNLDKNEPISE